MLGWAWTYVIVAELIGSSSGIGHMIIDSQALLATGADHLRHHRHRHHRVDLGLSVQGREPAACFRGAWHMSKLVIENVSRIFPAVRGGAPTRALEPTNLSSRGQ